MSNKKTVFAIGNAHLDPVWMWRWQEGSAEAKATIRSALDRMNEYPEFKFVCSSASVYKWIEEFDPDMFEEIKARVKEGRFIVVGGWFVQPDCNLPSGEGFARQSLYSQRYFFDRFGVTAKVGYNVDSFGHNGMLPQILRKSGMDAYIFMRPSPKENPLEVNFFNWVSPDGSSVPTYRIIDPYCFRFNKKSVLDLRLKQLRARQNEGIEEILFFYGVGNHGGGPTKKNIETILDYNKKHDDEITFADPQEFFDLITEKGYALPDWKDDLQHHASGCYSAVSKIKTLNRRAENALGKAEFLSILGNLLLNKSCPNAKIAEAWDEVCFNHFHDIMGGCAIKEAYDDAEASEFEAISVAEKLTNNAVQSLSWAVDTSDDKNGIPIVVFNPHPFPVTSVVTVNKQTDCITDENGKKVHVQFVFSSTNSCYRRRDTVFTASVPALGYRTYYMPKQTFLQSFVPELGKLCYALKRKCIVRRSSVRADGGRLENDNLAVRFDKETGHLLSIFDKNAQRELILRGAVPIVIDETDHDTWSHAKNYFDKQVGEFKLKSYEILERGPVRATVKVVSEYGGSTLTQYFTLTECGKSLDVRAKIDWHEKHKMLKLRFDSKDLTEKAYYEIPFGVIARPLNGEEEPMLTWAAVKDGSGKGFAILNDNKYSLSAKENSVYFTVVRSPIYGDHGGPRSAESPYTDQGEHDFSYAIKPINGEGYGETVRAAKLFNTPLINVIENNHKGKLQLSASIVENSAENVVISATKRGEDGASYVVRAYETDGRNVTAEIKIGKLPVLIADFTPFAVNTYILPDGKDCWEETLLTEMSN